MRVLFCVLDGLSPRYVGDMANLSALGRDGGWCRPGGLGVMPSSTYPNHATFVTGVPPARHGVVANEIPTAEGLVPSWERGPSVPTLFDAAHASDKRCAAVFGDHHLVGAMGAGTADFLWPGDGFSDQVATDVLGYAKDRETATRVVEAVHTDVDLIVAQLNEPDTAAHVFGPDSPEAVRRYRRTDAHLGTVIDSLRSRWDDWVVIVVSDHSQESVTVPAPIDLHTTVDRHGAGTVMVDDGAVAVVHGVGDTGWLTEVPEVEGILSLGDDLVLAWSAEGRWFSSVALPVRGVHGSPRTRPQVAVVGGGHPAAVDLAAEITLHRPEAAGWAGRIASLLGITAPADLDPVPDR